MLYKITAAFNTPVEQITISEGEAVVELEIICGSLLYTYYMVFIPINQEREAYDLKRVLYDADSLLKKPVQCLSAVQFWRSFPAKLCSCLVTLRE